MQIYIYVFEIIFIVLASQYTSIIYIYVYLYLYLYGQVQGRSPSICFALEMVLPHGAFCFSNFTVTLIVTAYSYLLIRWRVCLFVCFQATERSLRLIIHGVGVQVCRPKGSPT